MVCVRKPSTGEIIAKSANQIGVSLIAGMEYGMERWNGKWNGMVNVYSYS